MLDMVGCMIVEFIARASLCLIEVVEAFRILTLAVSSHSWWPVACSASCHLAPSHHNTFGLHRHLCRAWHYVILSSHNLHVLKVYTKYSCIGLGIRTRCAHFLGITLLLALPYC